MSDKVSKYNFPASFTGGVKPMAIRGIFEEEKNRLSEEFTDDERKWRKQWLKDQQLHPDEPRPLSEEWMKEFRNPIRRFLSAPWNRFENRLQPLVGEFAAKTLRYNIPKLIVMIGGIYYAWYWVKYNQADWTRVNGINAFFPKPASFPGEDNFPLKRERFEPRDYYDQGFKNRKVFLD